MGLAGGAGVISARRGQPVVVLLVILGSWVAGRYLMWEPPYVAATGAGVPVSGPAAASHRVREGAQPSVRVANAVELPAGAALPVRPPAIVPAGPPATVSSPALFSALAPALAPAPAASASAARPGLVFVPVAPPAAAGPVPAAPSVAAPASVAGAGPTAPRRWSADGWVLVRPRAGMAPLGFSVPTYGASQAGAILRYRLDPSRARMPTLYLRGSGALNGTGEVEGALGLSARPAPPFPAYVALEGRVTRMGDGTVHLRPVVMAVSEVPPLPLPMGITGELYLAGGYVAGKAATAFADGQGRVSHPLVRLGPVDFAMSGGVWGGVQRGAGRLDVGPGVTVAGAVAGANLRLSADWRFRVAGNASPKSGPALTLATSF